MVLPLLTIGTSVFFCNLVLLLTLFSPLQVRQGAPPPAPAAPPGTGRGTAQPGAAARGAQKAKSGLSKTVDIIGKILNSPFAPIAGVLFLCCCCCTLSVVLDVGGQSDTVMSYVSQTPLVGTVANIYVPLLRAEIQQSGLGPYLIESGPFGAQGYGSDFMTIIKNPWSLDWAKASEEEVNPIYDRGIIIESVDMIPSQPLSEQTAKLKITVKNTEQDVAANHIKFFVSNNEEVKQKTGLNFWETWRDDLAGSGEQFGNCYYKPCDDEEDYESDEAYEECVANNDFDEIESDKWYNNNDKTESGPCCEVCGEIDDDECDACLAEFNEAELIDERLPPNLNPLDTVSLVSSSRTKAHRVTEHGDVAAHAGSLDVIFEYQFEPKTNIFCTDARGMGAYECSEEVGEFNDRNEKEMSAYTFTILEPGDYTETQLLDWESQIVNYIAGGPIKVHVIHRKNDIYYRENPIFLHYKIENVGSDTDASEMVYLNPANMRIIIPEDLLIDPDSEDFLACKKVKGSLEYSQGGAIENPWICAPEIGGSCENFPTINNAAARTNAAGALPDDALEAGDYADKIKEAKECVWAWKYSDERIHFFEGGNIEIPFQIDTTNAKTDKEYTISFVFLGDKKGVERGGDAEAKSAYKYRLLETQVIAVQPTVAGTVAK